jgi:two-component system LytT family response regulator
MEDGSGFDLLDHFNRPDFKIIFISDYANYAIKAIDYNAMGYLLKPLDDQKFITAVQRISEMINHEEKLQMGLLEGNLKKMQEQENIMLRTSDQIHLVRFSELVRVEADGNYATFFVSDGRKVIVSKPMKEFEEKLLENGFIRIHKSHIINIKMIVYFDKAEGGFVIMSDQSRIPVSSRKRDAVVELFDDLSRSKPEINSDV